MNPRQSISLCERFDILSKSLGYPHAQVSFDRPVEEVLGNFARLDAEHLKAKYTPSARIQFMFLVLVGRYPTQEQRARWLTLLETSDLKATIQVFTQSKIYRDTQKSKTVLSLVQIPTDALYLDVTHTLQYPYNSGIQRVVRMISKQLQGSLRKTTFFRIDTASGQPHILTASEVDHLLDFGSRKQTLKKERWLWALREVFLKGPVRFLKYCQEDAKEIALKYYHRLRDDFLIPWGARFSLFRRCFDSLDRQKTYVKIFIRNAVEFFRGIELTAKPQVQEMPLFLNHQILMPECAYESARIEFYLSLKTSIPNCLTLLVYDLIPLIAPEFCEVNAEFVDYCRLLRVADRVNCISKNVMNDVAHFERITLRENPLPIQLGYLHQIGRAHV